MKYAIIDTEKGEQYGINPKLHMLLDDGGKMIVNENELRLVNANIEAAASEMGGTIMTVHEVNHYKKNQKTK